MEKCIIPHLQGGIGNQLFILAASYVISKKERGTTIKLPQCINPHKISKYDYYKTVFTHLPNTEYIEFPEEYLGSWEHFYRLSTMLQVPFVSPQKLSYSMWDVKDIPIPCVLEGYFQFYPPLEEYMNEICEYLSKGFKDICEELQEKYSISRENSVFIHIRRGDYLLFPDIHFSQDISYYEKAVSTFKKDVIFYIFSDDIEWCKTNSFFKGLSNKVFVEEDDEIISLAFMSLCIGGSICANSTFSWWGAMLGTHYNNKINNTMNTICVPKKWCIDEPIKLFPDEWILF